jgi:hypothetical protein
MKRTVQMKKSGIPKAGGGRSRVEKNKEKKLRKLNKR